MLLHYCGLQIHNVCPAAHQSWKLTMEFMECWKMESLLQLKYAIILWMELKHQQALSSGR